MLREGIRVARLARRAGNYLETEAGRALALGEGYTPEQLDKAKHKLALIADGDPDEHADFTARLRGAYARRSARGASIDWLGWLVWLVKWVVSHPEVIKFILALILAFLGDDDSIEAPMPEDLAT